MNAETFRAIKWHDYSDFDENSAGFHKWSDALEKICVDLTVKPKDIMAVLSDPVFRNALAETEIKGLPATKFIANLLSEASDHFGDKPNELHVFYAGDAFELGCSFSWNSDADFVRDAREWASTMEAKSEAFRYRVSPDDGLGDSVEIAAVTLLTANSPPTFGHDAIFTAIDGGSFGFLADRCKRKNWEILRLLSNLAAAWIAENQRVLTERVEKFKSIVQPKGNKASDARRALLQDGFIPAPKHMLIGQISSAIKKSSNSITVLDANQKPLKADAIITRDTKFSYNIEILRKGDSVLSIGRDGVDQKQLIADRQSDVGVGVEHESGQTFLDLIPKEQRRKSLMSLITEDVSTLTKSAYTIDFFVAILKNIMYSISDNPNQTTASKELYEITWDQIAETMGLNARTQQLTRQQIYTIRCELRQVLRAIMSHPISFKLSFGKGKKPLVYDGPLLNIQAVSETTKGGFGSGAAFASAKISLTDVLGSQLFGANDGDTPPSFSLMDSHALFEAGDFPTKGQASKKRTRYQQLLLFIDGQTYDAIRRAQGNPIVAITHDDIERETSISFTAETGTPESNKKARTRALGFVEEILTRMAEKRHIDRYVYEPHNHRWLVFIGQTMVEKNLVIAEAQSRRTPLLPANTKQAKALDGKNKE